MFYFYKRAEFFFLVDDLVSMQGHRHTYEHPKSVVYDDLRNRARQMKPSFS